MAEWRGIHRKLAAPLSRPGDLSALARARNTLSLYRPGRHIALRREHCRLTERTVDSAPGRSSREPCARMTDRSRNAGNVDRSALANELLSAHSAASWWPCLRPREEVSICPPPTRRSEDRPPPAARRDAARRPKVGFANRSMWRVLKLDTLVRARMPTDGPCAPPDRAL